MTKIEILEELVYEQKKHSICKHCPIRWNGGRSHPRAGKVRIIKPAEMDVVRHASSLAEMEDRLRKENSNDY